MRSHLVVPRGHRETPTRRASLATILLASCAASPPVEHPSHDLSLPATWTALGSRSAPPSSGATDRDRTDSDERPETPSRAAASSEHAQTWWSEFDDAQLDALVREALGANRDLRAAAERVAIAAARARIDGADVLPQLAAGADASRRKQNFIGLPVPGGGDVLTSRSTSYGLSLSASWEIDLWGRLRARESAALADLDAAGADVAAAELSLAGQVAKTWFAAIESQRQVELAAATLESFRETAVDVAHRYSSGVRPAIDTRFSRLDVANAEADLAERREVLDRTARQLEVLVGRYPGAELELSAGALPTVTGAPPAGIPSELVTRRPDLAVAERRLAAAGARVDEARAALYPRLSLSASGGTSTEDIGDLFDRAFSVWQIAGNLLQPIFQGGRLAAAVDLAKADQRVALESYVQLVLLAFAEVETALARERELAAREAALVRAAREAAAARDEAERRYRGGLGEFIVVREAQRSEYRAESQVLRVRRLRADARVDVHLALGGGFDSTPRTTDESDADAPDAARDSEGASERAPIAVGDDPS